MSDALVVYQDGSSRRMPADEAEAFAARNGLHVLPIAWDGARGSEAGPYLSTDLHDTRTAPKRRPAPHGSVRAWL